MGLSVTIAHLEETTITAYSAGAEMIVLTTITTYIITTTGHLETTTITDQIEYLAIAQAVQEQPLQMGIEFLEAQEVVTTSLLQTAPLSVPITTATVLSVTRVFLVVLSAVAILVVHSVATILLAVHSAEATVLPAVLSEEAIPLTPTMEVTEVFSAVTDKEIYL